MAPSDPEENADLSSFADADSAGSGSGDATDADSPDPEDSDGFEANATDTDTPAEFVRDDAERPREETVELGVELLAHLEADDLPLPEVMDRIETITSDPTVARDILDTAETRGIVERDGARIRSRTGGVRVEFERQVVRREGDYDCRRCGKSLSTGHFVQFDTGEVGPFGSSCIEKVVGRE